MPHPTVQIHIDGDGCWPDLIPGTYLEADPSSYELALLPGGMQSGKPSVTLRMKLENGDTVLAQFSLAIFKTALDALAAAATTDGPR